MLTQDKEVRKLQHQVDTLVGELQNLDFSDLESVITWLENFCVVNEHYLIQIPKKNILDYFQKEGFHRYPAPSNFDLESEKRMARWIIGEAMSMLDGTGWNQYQVTGRMRSGWILQFSRMWRRHFHHIR
ncbi:MAG: hypothetical protein COV59_01150 [Candidatus Magasanikbacteria bacterium CG11_big_fil_rev_8_21_14_0_20_39_34]|uniref:Uncharacterized protein n=1 Tax=Candidatus Magasanikbacteria bacterium CG11_big_fil_rev_8_21_14_0_20_39_34 TaxID=1974653 RepID=A0A2H0N6C9_9BACT|nr:MAG: hypothetical protein COV59_01150 [Candidatus Magasanikbacteria bacterium CG11_big_fil_rev_8_21_14_0_20_39_34]